MIRVKVVEKMVRGRFAASQPAIRHKVFVTWVAMFGSGFKIAGIKTMPELQGMATHGKTIAQAATEYFEVDHLMMTIQRQFGHRVVFGLVLTGALVFVDLGAGYRTRDAVLLDWVPLKASAPAPRKLLCFQWTASVVPFIDVTKITNNWLQCQSQKHLVRLPKALDAPRLPR